MAKFSHPSPRLIPLSQLLAWLKTPITVLYRRYWDLNIDKKLILSFGLLVSITFLVVGTIFIGSLGIAHQVFQTQQVHFPTALTSAQAQANLLKMRSNVRGYLATAESEFRNQYQISRQNFEADLATMNTLLSKDNPNSDSLKDLTNLESLYQSWLLLPERMFTLRDDEIENEPALKQLQEEGEVIIATILNGTDRLIAAQSERSPTTFSISTLQNLVEFKSCFSASTAALRSYLVTNNSTFRFDYTYQAKNARMAWDLVTQAATRLNPAQARTFQQLQQAYSRYQTLPDELFEGNYRQDLLIFQTQAEPLATQILDALGQIVDEEQALLSQQLARSRNWIVIIQWQTLTGGGLSLALAVALAAVLRRYIAVPIRRLTVATARIMEGNYNSQAQVESRDEIGILAETFNNMTRFLQRSHTALEDYSRSLESKVAQRTRELEQKNHQLTSTVEELQRTQSQLVQTEKMSSLGQLVAGVAHEINNPVTFIYGNVEHTSTYTQDLIELVNLYQTVLPHPEPEIRTHIQDIDLEFLVEDLPRSLNSMRIGAQRIQEIVASLRNFSRMDEADVKTVDLHEGLDSTLMILRNRLKQNRTRSDIIVEKHYSQIPLVECYPGQLNQVFMNILSNAIDALEMRQEQEPDFPAVITIKTTSVEDNYVLISIRDNGPGIEPKHRDRLFDPFYTTKPAGKGTGLGLSISYQVITERHQGELQCESTPAQGATFNIKIPIRQPPSALP